MKAKRLLQWVILASIAGLLLAGCLPGRRGATGRAEVAVEAIPLSARSYDTAAARPDPTPTPPAPAPTASPEQAAPANAAAHFDAATPRAWFDLAYTLVRDEKLAPPVAARLFGYAGVALYEAVAPGVPGATSLAGQLNELPPLPQPDLSAPHHWPAAANAALATVFQALFAAGGSSTQRAIADLEKRLHDSYAASAGVDVLARSVAQGQRVGLAITQWAQADGYAYLSRCAYTAPAGPGLWEPTAPDYGPPLLPCWGQMRPFVLHERSDECQPETAPVYSADPTSQFYFEALEVYLTVTNLTPQQQELARYWADDAGVTGTPPGHAIAILTQVSAAEDLTLDAAAAAYARLGIALADAFISCWQSKFATHVVRPVTYIQEEMDPGWAPPVTTPPFPEYTSGHSVQSAAAAAVLTAVFGADYAFTDHTHDALGYAARTFASFDAMADEAAISRLYGGIHYRSAIEAGLTQGRCVGQRVLALRLTP